MRHEIVDRELKYIFHLLEFDFAPSNLRGVERGLIVVVQQMVIVGCRARCCGTEEMFWQNNFGPEAGSIGSIVALADSVKAIAGGNHPGA